MSYVLGLDFGTSSTAAVAGSGTSLRTVTLGKRAGSVPSAAFVRADGTIVYGDDAVLGASSSPSRLAGGLRRLLRADSRAEVGGRSYDSVELVAGYLAWVVACVAEREGGVPARIMMTHPAAWSPARLECLRRAVAAAGLQHVEFASEPVAAGTYRDAVAPLETGSRCVIFDLGGASFDVAVVERTTDGINVVGQAESIDHLGGEMVDEAMAELVRTRLGDQWNAARHRGGELFDLAAAHLARECVSAKETLSSEHDVELGVMLPGCSTSVRITRGELEDMIAPALDETTGVLRRTLARTGTAAASLSSVVLIGGAARMPIVERVVAAAIGTAVPVVAMADSVATARGAAVLAGRSLGVRP